MPVWKSIFGLADGLAGHRWFCEYVVHWSAVANLKLFIRKTALNPHKKVQKRQQEYYRLVIINHTQSAVKFPCCDWKIVAFEDFEARTNAATCAAWLVQLPMLNNKCQILNGYGGRHRNTEARRELEAFSSRNTKGIWTNAALRLTKRSRKQVADQLEPVSNNIFQGDLN